jgi:hypothetical protein
MKRPTYMTARLPLLVEAVCMTTPTSVMRPVPISAHRRPYRSVSQGVMKQAAKQPAWRVEATDSGEQLSVCCSRGRSRFAGLAVLGHVGFGFGVVRHVAVLPRDVGQFRGSKKSPGMAEAYSCILGMARTPPMVPTLRYRCC